MASDITKDGTSRFSILVPKPKARINLGKPDPGGEEAFGYTGMSLQSSAHLFVDVNKVSLFQAGSTACWQAGGKWLQWSDGPMYMATESNNTVAAGRKMLVAAGAGQGIDLALTHGLAHVTPRVVEYNNLELHYLVEEVHNGLKELFYGEQKDEWHAAEKKGQADQSSAAGTYDKGFLKEYGELLEDLGYDDKARSKLLQPYEWVGDHLGMHFKQQSVYPAFNAFDPYPAQHFRGPVSKVFAGFVELVIAMHRFVDLLRAIMPIIVDHTVGQPVEKLIVAWGAAQDGLNSALNVADIARFDRDTGKAEAGGAWKDETDEIAAHAGEQTKAKIESKTGPFNIGGMTKDSAGKLLMKVRTVKGGAETEIDFAEFLEARPAIVEIATSDTIRRIGIKKTDADGTVVIDGATVSYTKSSDTWGTLPGGFAWDPATAHTAIKKSDGSPFTAKATGGVEIEDGTFEAGEVLHVIIDGAQYDVDLSTVKLELGTSGAHRAESLRDAINAKKASAASVVDETTVKIQSTNTGSAANVKVFAQSAVMTKLGMAGMVSATGGAAGVVSAAELKEKLEAASASYSAEITGSTVTVEHGTTGSSSYLELSEGPAVFFFGSDPAEAEGEDGRQWSGNGFFAGLSNARSHQYEYAKWPEGVRNLMRPVYEAVGDVVTVFDKLQAIVETLPVKGGPPKVLGLLGKDGLTLGTGGHMYGAGKNITLVATPHGEPDERKYIPKIEIPVHWGLEFNLWDTLANKLNPKPKPKDAHKADEAGDFRVVAKRDISMAAGNVVRMNALHELHAEAKAVFVRLADNVHVLARDGFVSMKGKTVYVGEAPPQDKNPPAPKKGEQAATDAVKVTCTNKVDLSNAYVRAVLDKEKIILGTQAAKALDIDDKKPRVYIDDKKVSFGLIDGGKELGLTVSSSGDVIALAKSKLELGAGTVGITVGSGEVAVAGKLKVGSALLVNGDGTFTPAAAQQIFPMAQSRMAALKVEYAQAIVKATTDKQLLAGLKTARDLARGLVDSVLLPPARANAKKEARRLRKKVEAAEKKRAEAKVALQKLIDEARFYEMTDQDLGRNVPADDDLFV